MRRPTLSPRLLFVGAILALGATAVLLVARGGATGLNVSGPTPIRPDPNITPFQGLGVWV